MTDVRNDRRERKRLEIQEHACRLVVERGFDGFTMDELAEVVGVSRRTLFNYVPDKAHAVLGPAMDENIPGGFDDFLAGRPTGELVPDVVELVRTALCRTEVEDPQALTRFFLVERAVATDPKLVGLMRLECERSLEVFAAHICTRQGWVDGDLRARVLLSRVMGAVLLMLEEVVRRRGGGSFAAIFDEILAADAELFGGLGALSSARSAAGTVAS